LLVRQYSGLVDLQEALTTFPSARSVGLYHFSGLWGAAESEALVEWLRERGRGAGTTMVGVTVGRAWASDVTTDFVDAALRGGALPSLQGVTASLERGAHRTLLTEGHLGGVRELRLVVVCTEALEPQLAALGVVRDLPALTELHVSVRPGSHDAEAQWPPFIPPPVKKLRTVTGEGPVGQALLCALPGTLGASRAGLDNFRVTVPSEPYDVGEGLVHVAQALRCCCSTLKDFCLGGDKSLIGVGAEVEYDEDKGERDPLRVQWVELLAGVFTCRELEVLKLLYVVREPLFPPGTSFGRSPSSAPSTTGASTCPRRGRWGCGRWWHLGGCPSWPSCT
jgi:hypothetical protein